jgi:hypothetical protein
LELTYNRLDWPILLRERERDWDFALEYKQILLRRIAFLTCICKAVVLRKVSLKIFLEQYTISSFQGIFSFSIIPSLPVLGKLTQSRNVKIFMKHCSQ